MHQRRLLQRPGLVFFGAHSLNHHGRGRLWEKLGSCSSNSISEWKVYRTVETTGILYQEGSFLREARREKVIIRIHRRGFPMNAERNFTLQLDPQLWSACISFLLLDVSDVAVLVVTWWSGWFMCLLWTVFSAPTEIHGKVPTDLILYIWALPFWQKVMTKSIMFQLQFFEISYTALVYLHRLCPYVVYDG